MPTEPRIIEAEAVLNANWRNGFTVPTDRLYPFQWNWDAGFTALGWAHFDLERAITELETLFSGQWGNGMVPHILFHSENETTYFPNHDFWRPEVNAGAPATPRSSGITQPPVHGFVAERLLTHGSLSPDLASRVRALWPQMVASHRFFYTYRDPEGEGLAFIFHPWESGRDNSPLWDDALNSIEIAPGNLPKYQRRDLDHADASHRPTQAQYDGYVYLLELGKRHGYDGPGIFAESPFLVQDTLINGILIQSNASLIRMGQAWGEDTRELEAWQEKAIASYRTKLWNAELGTFTAFDLRNQRPIASREIGAFTALSAQAATPEQAAQLNEYLQDLHARGYYLCPSFDVDSPLFDSCRYWRGPVWPQMNWLIYQGLKRYGFPETAELVREDLLTLVGRHGFWEYFEADKDLAGRLDHGYGGNNFSWTAASWLDLLAETKPKQS